MYHMCVWCLQGPEEVVGDPATGVIDYFELPCCCQKLNTGLLQWYPVISADGHLVLILLSVFQTGSQYVYQDSLKLSETHLGAGIEAMHHHTR